MRRKSLGMRPWRKALCAILRPILNAKFYTSAGMFHTQQGLGTAASILRRNPNLKVVIITPVGEISPQSDDYQLQVLTPPVRYVQKAHQAEAINALKNRNTDLVCE